MTNSHLGHISTVVTGRTLLALRCHQWRF